MENTQEIDDYIREQEIFKYLIRGWWLTQKIEELKKEIPDDDRTCPFCLSNLKQDDDIK